MSRVEPCGADRAKDPEPYIKVKPAASGFFWILAPRNRGTRCWHEAASKKLCFKKAVNREVKDEEDELEDEMTASERKRDCRFLAPSRDWPEIPAP